MKNRESKITIFTWLLFVIAGAASVYSIYFFQLEKMDFKLFLVAAITILLSGSTQIQLPRTKIHFSLAEAFIFFVLLTYGLEAAVLLAAMETLYSSFLMRRRQVNIKNRTIFLNASITATSTFCAGIFLYWISDRLNLELTLHDFQSLTVLLFVLSAAHFLVNSVLVAFFSALKTEESFRQIFFKNCFNALIMYLIGAPVTAIMIKTADNINPVFLLAGVLLAGIAYITYRRYIDDIKDTSLKAEQAERMRAEQAEKHVLELQHYISEIEAGSKALKESEKKLRYTAFHDTLTDLPNRNNFLDKLEFLIEKGKYSPEFKFAVLNLNLNRFKTINDSLGHSTGNLLLKEVGRRISGLIDKKDFAARLASDEFAVILTGIENIDEAIGFAAKLNQKISEPYTFDNRQQVFASSSIGIVVHSEHYTEAENFIRDANIAMYHAKKNTAPYVIFDQHMHTQAVTRLQIETDLRYAVERNELLVYYQPILELDSIELVGFEALMRWQHPKRGLVPPVEFIPISETTGLIVPMTLWILRESCKKIVEWTRINPTGKKLMISVNFSGKHFAHPDLVEQVKKIIYETGVDVSSLKLEITESAVMENAESAIRTLKELRSLGVQLSIDDFGTGYSSLSYLHRFPINTLKVDRSFVSSMETGTENGEIVRTIIGLAKTLKLNVIAEGIESIHQLHQLRVLGCEYGQGYLFSRPVPVDEAERLIMDIGRWRSILPPHRSGIVQHGRTEDFTVLELDEVLPNAHDIIQ